MPKQDKENHTEFSVCDYDHRQFEALEHNAMITVMYRAADSIGNVTYKQSKVYIVDTASRRDTEAHTRENARAYLRFISAEYLWSQDKEKSRFIRSIKGILPDNGYCGHKTV